MNLTTGSSNVIKILVKIDPEKIRSNYENPSTNKDNPTGISRHDVSMTVTSSREDKQSQEGTDMTFTSNPGDVVSFSSTTSPADSSYTVSIYRLDNYSGDRIFSRPEITENSIELQILRPGMATFMLFFGIYTKDGDGKPKDLVGCFYFDPSITIS